VLPEAELEAVLNRLKRNGREESQDFDINESLFLRFPQLSAVDGRLYPPSIKFPAFSVNRDRFSRFDDVLFWQYPKYASWGVCSFLAKDIPTPITTEEHSKKTTMYEFCVWHVPEDDNFAHSEVKTYSDDKLRLNDINSKIVKKRFRYCLSEKINILKSPT